MARGAVRRRSADPRPARIIRARSGSTERRVGTGLVAWRREAVGLKTGIRRSGLSREKNWLDLLPGHQSLALRTSFQVRSHRHRRNVGWRLWTWRPLQPLAVW